MFSLIEGGLKNSPIKNKYTESTKLCPTDTALLDEAASDFKGIRVLSVVPDEPSVTNYSDEQRAWSIYDGGLSPNTSVYISGNDQKLIGQVFDRFYSLVFQDERQPEEFSFPVEV